MKSSPRMYVHAVIGSMAVTVGLWMLLGELSLPLTILVIVAATVILVQVSSTSAYVWMWTTCTMGIESLAWPLLVMGSMADLGPEPPLEDMQRVFTAVLFGVFSGVFWLTFAYGIYRRIRNTLHPVEPPSPLTKAQRKKKRQRSF